METREGTIQNGVATEAVILMGIQATGKSTFFCERFARTHVRINLDMLRPRHREDRLLKTCVDCGIPFVVDNTNPTVAERARYIGAARSVGFRILGFYFESKLAGALARNALRPDGERIPELGVLGTSGRFERPRRAEGFDELSYVRIGTDGRFVVNESDERRRRFRQAPCLKEVRS